MNLDLSQVNLTTAASVATLSFFVAYHVYLRNSDKASKFVRVGKLAEKVDWLDQESYAVLASFCDAFIPSLSLQECDEDAVLAAIESLHPEFAQHKNLFDVKALLSHKTFLCTGALDYGTHKHAVDALHNLTTKADKQQLSLILKVLTTSVGSFLLTGYPVPYQKLPLWARERAIRYFRDSSLEPLRNLYATFKRLTISLYLSYAERGSRNPAWDALKYHPATSVKDLQTILDSPEGQEIKSLKQAVNYRAVYKALNGGSTTSNEVDELNIDVVVVGSGAGGGTIAYELVKAGYNVLVLEKGGFFTTADFARWRECEAMAHAYEKGGLCTSADGNVVVLAGACVGGGTTINWSASFYTPSVVLEDWTSAGMPQFDPVKGDFVQSLHAVHELYGINSNYSYYGKDVSSDNDDAENRDFKMNENNRLLWEGSKKLGYTPEKIPRNTKKCVDCGHCGFGCSHKSKQSSMTALLEPLLLQQLAGTLPSGYGKLYIVPDCHVSKVLFEDETQQKAVGVAATVSLFADDLPTVGLDRTLLTKRQVVVNSKIVVAACGSIHTPAFLLRSGLKHPLIGKHLTLHPVLGGGGVFPKDQPTGLGEGVSMGVVVRSPRVSAEDAACSEAQRCEEARYAVAIETPPLHTGLLGVLLPWKDGLSIKTGASGWSQLSAFIGISRDRSQASNRVDIDAEGNPVIHYRVTAADTPMLLAGLEASLRMIRASGAKGVFYSHNTAPWYFCSNNDEAAFEAFIAKMKKEGLCPLKMQIFSAHQMGSCRMASCSEEGPVSPTGELFDCKNLFVADGSVLPTSLGINPMITIEAFAHLIAKKVVTRLQSWK